MPIESKECFTNLTLDGQLYEIYQAAQTGGGGVTAVTATAPITSSGGANPNISTSIATNRIVGRSTAGTGVMEELTPVGITVSGGNITGIGGTVGTVDNAIPRADGTGGFTVQGSNIVIDDATTSTQNNIAITNQHAGQTNSALVLTPKGTGALIAGPKPNGAASGGNARGIYAVDLQTVRSAATQVASGARAFIGAGQNNTTSGSDSVVCGGRGNSCAGADNAVVGGEACSISAGTNASFIGAAVINLVSGAGSCAVSGAVNTVSSNFSGILGGYYGLANRYAMQAHAAGQFAAQGDAQRARFVLRCKTTTNSAVEMALDGGTTYLTIPSGKVIFLNIKIVGVRSDGVNVATYERQYAAKNVSATSSQIYAPITIGSDNAAGTVLDITTQDTGDYISIKVTGILNETWRWVASVDAVEVAYGT